MKTGIDALRGAVLAFNNVREDFLQQFSAQELLTLYAAWMACEWDIWPDQWSDAQVKAALRGEVPRFDDDGRPLRPRRARRARP